MGEGKTYAILLRKTSLANDDMVLEFFTAEWGRVSIFAKKFARSKKRREVDFFRLLELGIFQGRNSKSLKTATTVSLFHGFEQSFAATEKGFEWLEKLRKNLPEEKPMPNLFQQVIKMFGHFEEQYEQKLDAFFQTKLLASSGVFPHFDQIRSDVFFDLDTSHLSETETSESLKIQNLSRQILEFLRRSTFEEFWAKKEKLPEENFEEIEMVIKNLEQQYH